mgnify:FL=1
MKFLFPFAKRFIAGHDFKSAKPVIDKLISDGYMVSIGYLGELSRNKKDCERAYKEYMNVIDVYRDSKIDISIKPSQLGLKFDPKMCHYYTQSIVWAAYTNNQTVRLDMEDASLIKPTLDLCYKLRKDTDNVGVALQTNMLRTKKDLPELMTEKVSIRLVKGAYKGNNKIAYQNKKQIEKLFLKQSLMMLSDRSRSYYHLKDADTPVHAIGTHDSEIIRSIIKYLKTIKITKQDFDFELLYGIRRDLSKELKDRGFRVRLYVPFGKDWLPYTLRRLKEWKNLKFVISNIFKEIFRF